MRFASFAAALIAGSVAACGSTPPAPPRSPVAAGVSACQRIASPLVHHATATAGIQRERDQRSSLAAGVWSDLASAQAEERLLAELPRGAALPELGDLVDAARRSTESIRAWHLRSVELTDRLSAEAAPRHERADRLVHEAHVLCDAKFPPAECPAALELFDRVDAVPLFKADDWAGIVRDLRAFRPKNRALAALAPKLADEVAPLAERIASWVEAYDTEYEAYGATDAARDVAFDAIRARCQEPPPEAFLHPGAADGWVVDPKRDVRALSVVVRVRPPAPIAQALEFIARVESEPAVADVFRGTASGGFGSGSVVVRREGGEDRTFVVTNRHVVEYAGDIDIVLEDGRAFPGAEVLFVDPRYDVAVLAFPADVEPPFRAGFGFDFAPVRDQATVVASGFPGFGNRPSYQVSRGYVSNARFVLEEEGLDLVFVQHTAPIDGGSSGGPLTDERAALVGINTFKAVGRENAAFAVPATAVANAVVASTAAASGFASADARRQGLRLACLEVVGEYADLEPRVARVEERLANTLLAREGLASANLMMPDNPALQHLFHTDPLRAMAVALFGRLGREFNQEGGISPWETCAAPKAKDWDQVLDVDRVTFPVRLRTGARNLAFRWEAGRYRLSDVRFAR